MEPISITAQAAINSLTPKGVRKNIIFCVKKRHTHNVNFASIAGVPSAQIASDFDICPLEIPVQYQQGREIQSMHNYGLNRTVEWVLIA